MFEVFCCKCGVFVGNSAVDERYALCVDCADKEEEREGLCDE